MEGGRAAATAVPEIEHLEQSTTPESPNTLEDPMQRSSRRFQNFNGLWKELPDIILLQTRFFSSSFGRVSGKKPENSGSPSFRNLD